MSFVTIHKDPKDSKSCIGIVLWKYKQRFVQLWYCPSGYNITPHSHPKEDVELMYLFGSATFYRKTKNVPEEFYTPKWFNAFKKFTVPAGTYHWFSVSCLPLVFINLSKFKEGHKAVSASEDICYVK